MAPEVCALGVVNDAHNEKVDVWAVGILAIELALGCIPGDHLRGETRMIETSVRNIPDELRASGYSVEYQHFAKRCLERDLSLRPSAADLLTFRSIQLASSDHKKFVRWLENSFASD